VHAVVVADESTDLQGIVRQANVALLDHQKIRGISRWPGGELPRTEGTRKLKRREVRDWVISGASTTPGVAHPGGLEGLLAQFGSGRAVSSEMTLDELGLSSLERVELMVALEEKFGRPIDEAQFAQATTVAALEELITREPAAEFETAGSAEPVDFRYRLAVAMAKEFFKAHFFPADYSRTARLTNGLNYYLASLFFNAFPLPQREAGARQTLRYIGDLVTNGWSVLIFPEGKRTTEGEINPFRPGIGMIGSRLNVPIVPVRIEGLDKVLHQTAKMATPGPVRVAFGAPLHLTGDDYAALTRQVEEAVRRL
jgi:long-chain acyl-CoA synthetase